MIRKFQNRDLPRVMEIWLASNLEAHHVVSSEYWLGKQNLVQTLLPQSNVYVFLYNGMIVGFMGLHDDFIEGLFVDRMHRSRGIGGSLMDFVKSVHGVLALHVYKENVRAYEFYLKNGFTVSREWDDEETGKRVFEMVWQK